MRNRKSNIDTNLSTPNKMKPVGIIALVLLVVISIDTGI